jgi:hypothetical protein
VLAAERPILTDVYEHVNEFSPDAASIYIFRRSSEERSEQVPPILAGGSGVPIEVLNEERFSTLIQVGDEQIIVPLRSERSLAAFWARFPVGTPIYLDITGLSHHVWSVLLKSGLAYQHDMMALYVEPADYKYSAVATDGEIFDLSLRTEGIDSLPGFATLAEESADLVFIPLLGFEGARLAHLLEETEPAADRIIPIVGVPGFRLEYPFHTYAGNKRVLTATGAWRRARFAAANCPFSLYYVLEDISRDFPLARLSIAPIGTKPHALGAVLFKVLQGSTNVELVYDFPIRKPGRTRGADRLFVYHVATLAGGALRGQ